MKSLVALQADTEWRREAEGRRAARGVTSGTRLPVAPGRPCRSAVEPRRGCGLLDAVSQGGQAATLSGSAARPGKSVTAAMSRFTAIPLPVSLATLPGGLLVCPCPSCGDGALVTFQKRDLFAS